MAIFPTFGAQVMPALANNSESLLQLGAGLLGGRTAQEQLAGGVGGFADARLQAKQRNKTLEFLRQQNPDLAAAVESGAMSGGDAYKLFYQQKLEAQKPKGIMNIGGAGYNQDTGEWITPPQGVGTDKETFYGNPIPIQTPQGIQYGQIGSRGSFKPIDIGQGNTFAPAVKTVDTGTATALVGPGGVQVGAPIQKDIAGKAAQEEIGTAQGKAAVAAPGDLQAGLNAKELIANIRNDPYKERGTGFSSYGNSIRGTGGYDFQNKVDQAKSGAFLTAIQQMRGLGALSNSEGGAATAAVNRMNTASSMNEFDAALNDYEKIIDQGIARAQQRIQQSGGQIQAPPGAGNVDDLLKKYGGQ